MSTTVSPTIRRLRQRKRLTPADIERLTRGVVKRGALSMIERGKVPNPSFPRVNTLAAALEITPQACYDAIAASVVAGSRPEARRGRGRPPGPAAPRVTPLPPSPRTSRITAALSTARELCATLEALAADGPPGRR